MCTHGMLTASSSSFMSARVLWGWHGLLMDAALANPVIQLLLNTLWWPRAGLPAHLLEIVALPGGGEQSFHYKEAAPSLFPLCCPSMQLPRAGMEEQRPG